MNNIQLSKANEAYLSNKSQNNNVTTPITSIPKQIEDGENKMNKALLALGVMGAAGVVLTCIFRGKNPKNVAQTEDIQKLVKQLQDIDFNKSQAKLKDGTLFTGVIEDTLKSGEKITIEYTNGIIQKSTKVSNGIETIKEYTNGIVSKKNGEVIDIKKLQKEAKEQQAKLKQLLKDDKISAEEFKKQSDEIKYKSKNQEAEIQEALDKKIKVEYAEAEKLAKEKAQKEEAERIAKEQEAIAVAKYKYGSDQEINQGLRFGKATNETVSEIQTIDQIYDRVMPSEIEQTLYRGVHIRQNSKYADTLKNLKVGDTLSEDAYLSVTSDYDIAQSFARGKNGYIFEIKMPKGSKKIDIESYRGIEAFDKNIPSKMQNESEFLLQRGSNLKIVNINKNGKQTIIECEYIGSTPKEVTCVSLNTPEEILNYKLEKIFAHPDAADDKYIASAIQDCVKAGKQKSGDIAKLIELLKDRVAYMQDSTIFSVLIGNKNNNILSYYDNNGDFKEMIDLLKYMDSNSKLNSCFSVSGNISVALQEGLELSTPCLKALIEADFLPKSWTHII